MRAELHGRVRAPARLQALAQVAQAVPPVGFAWRMHAAVVELQVQAPVAQGGRQGHGDRPRVLSHVVLDGVLHRRQQQQGRQSAGERGLAGRDVHLQAVPEAGLHQRQERSHQAQLLGQGVLARHLGRGGLAQQLGQVAQQAVGAIHVFVHEVRNQVQAVEQEVGLHLLAQAGQAGLGELPARALQLFALGARFLHGPDAVAEGQQDGVAHQVLRALVHEHLGPRVGLVAHPGPRVNREAQPEHARHVQGVEGQSASDPSQPTVSWRPPPPTPDQDMQAQGQAPDHPCRTEFPHEGLPVARATDLVVVLQGRYAEQQAHRRPKGGVSKGAPTAVRKCKWHARKVAPAPIQAPTIRPPTSATRPRRSTNG